MVHGALGDTGSGPMLTLPSKWTALQRLLRQRLRVRVQRSLCQQFRPLRFSPGKFILALWKSTRHQTFQLTPDLNGLNKILHRQIGSCNQQGAR